MAAEPQAIARLPEAVVNRIAAGEVIQRPANAVKELLENSIDAGATHITITVKEGGMKSLRIQDDGHGIRKEDLPILCERHTTSKIRTYDDLMHIDTLGFRGEALASISYVSHLSITTMTASEQTHGWKASYTDGELAGAPKPCAATKGTTILAEDLFYNVPLRRKALKSASEEYAAILDVVGRYAVYHAGAAFTVKRASEARVDLNTLPGASRVEAIRAVYGAAVAKHLLPISLSKFNAVSPEKQDKINTDSDGLSCEVQGYVTGAEYSGKKTQLVLFINGRAVDSTPLKRTLEATYTTLLPKATKPFFFLDIKLPSSHVDVNVHPTKKEVAFLHQEALIDAIRQACEETLLASNATRTFAQTLLPGAPLPRSDEGTGGPNGEKTAYYRPDKLVRTDAKTQTLHAFLNPGNDAGQGGGGLDDNAAAAAAAEDVDTIDEDMDDVERGAKDDVDMVEDAMETGGRNPAAVAAAAALGGAVSRRKRERNGDVNLGGSDNRYSTEYEFMPTAMEITAAAGQPIETQQQQQQQQPHVVYNTEQGGGATTNGVPSQLQRPVRHRSNSGADDSRLRSVQQLLRAAEKSPHQGLKDILQSPTYVGMADSSRALIQYGTRLYLADLSTLTSDMFYQQTLRRFGQAPRIRLQPPPSVKELCLVALQADEVAGLWKDSEEGGTKEEVADLLCALLIKKASILSECFSIDINQDGRISSLPQLIEQYTPDVHRLPGFILSLGQDVDWSEESACFDGIARALGKLYSLQVPLLSDGSTRTEDEQDNNMYEPDSAYASAAAGKGGDQGGEDNNVVMKERRRREWCVQHVLLPALRLFLVPSKARGGDGSLVELTRLENLYRVFERC